jgi:hypothetical protein
MPAEIVVLEGTLVGFVEEIGIEYDSAIGSIGDLHRLDSDLLQPCRNIRFILIAVAVLEVPFSWRFFVIDDQLAGLLVEVGLVRDHPTVHVGRRGVGMDVEPAARTVVFEGPGLGESVLLEDAGKFQPSLLGDVEEQGGGESAAEKGPDVSILVILLPHRGLPTESAQCLQRFVNQKPVDIDHLRLRAR